MLFPFPGLGALVLGVLGASVLINPAIFQWLPVSTYLLPYFTAGIVVWWLTQHLGMRQTASSMAVRCKHVTSSGEGVNCWLSVRRRCK
jgi:hypothetical protein